MKINVINVVILAFAAAIMVSCQRQPRYCYNEYPHDCKFEIQPDGSVNYTIEGETYKYKRMVFQAPLSKYKRMVYLVPFNKERIIDSAAVWPISGKYKFEGTLPRQGVYIVLSDTTDYKYSNSYYMATLKIFNDSFTLVSEREKKDGVIGQVCHGDIEGAPLGAVYVYHASDTANPVYANRTNDGCFGISEQCLWTYGAGYYSIRYKSEGRLIYAADSIYLSDSSSVRLYGKYKQEK